MRREARFLIVALILLVVALAGARLIGPGELPRIERVETR